MDSNTRPRRMRVKTDEAVNDPDWAGTNASPTEPVGGAAILKGVATYRGADLGHCREVWICVFARDVNGALLNRGGTTAFDVQFTETFPRDNPTHGAGQGAAVGVVDGVSATGCTLNRWVAIPCNGSDGFTVRLTNIVNLPGGTTDLEVWWRPVA